MTKTYGIDIEIPFSTLPADLGRPEEWDFYWQSKRLQPALDELQARCRLAWLALFRQRGYRSILLAGNGISQEPQYFAFAGLEAVAMDISAVATTWAAKGRWTEDDLCASFGIVESERRSFLRELARWGGKATYEVGDLFLPDHCEGPFDVVLSRRTLQLFPPEKRLEGLRCLQQRMSPKGLLLLEVAEDKMAYQELCEQVKALGMSLYEPGMVAGWDVEISFYEAPH